MKGLFRNLVSGYLATKTMNYALNKGVEKIPASIKENFSPASPIARGALYGLGVWSAARVTEAVTEKIELKKIVGPASLISLAGHMAVGAAIVYAEDKFSGLTSKFTGTLNRGAGLAARSPNADSLRENYLTPPSDFDEPRNRSGITH